MIKCNKSKCKVLSKSGKLMSKTNLTRSQAEKRLRDIEYFKHKKNDSN